MVDLKVRKIENRQRQIEAKIELPYSPDQVWKVLTDYEALPEFIPNLEASQRVDHPEGGIRIEQVGSQNALMMKFSARVVLDMEENFPQALNFDMVEGDFKAFGGQWRLAPCDSCAAKTELTYSVKIWPKRTMPILAVEKRLSKDLPVNLQAIRQRLDALYGAESASVA
ncbi:MAG: cyclase [Acaryochloridaceae cyanobacterium RL_2_7]|nr:cyclase [Acaryochloridaceae cyanobacterium RL_2_7]